MKYENEQKDVFSLALVIAGAIVGIISAYQSGELNYAWYWNIVSCIFHACGGVLVIGGVSLIIAIILKYMYDSVKEYFKK